MFTWRRELLSKTQQHLPELFSMSLDSRVNRPLNKQHYDFISDAWQYLLGTNFHWGYFQSAEDSLERATDNLIDLLVQPFHDRNDASVLDVGCGIGGPALYLAKKYGWRVTGFSTSEEGISRAKQRGERSDVSGLVRFDVRDALDNRFDEQSFDAVMLLEMSHLIHNKPKLIAESIRPLKVGGRISLCDLMLQRRLTAREIVEKGLNIAADICIYGRARLETLAYYREIFEKCGIEDIQIADISTQVVPTIAFWRENATSSSELLSQYFSQADIDNFFQSCDILQEFYENRLWGYGVISGTKVSSQPNLNNIKVNQALF